MVEITPVELAARRACEPIAIIDVREPWEYALCAIEGSTLIPLETLPAAAPTLARDAITVMVCHHGMRSHYAAEYLRSLGFPEILNLTGGIHRWASDVETSMRQY
jgi:rhodanese-related sulfurtransferase